MDWLILAVFCAALLSCVVLDISILYALIFGLLLFLIYGRTTGHSWRRLLTAAWDGIRTVRSILIIFLLIGIMTAFWRAAGTIPVIVSWASKLIRPFVFLLMIFLLNCGVSVLTGTSFGTAATMGVICASIGSSMNIHPMFTGGAILSGVFFGDRCSPVSTSALLVAAITGTNIYDNIRKMLKTALIPFALTCLIYLFTGASLRASGTAMDLTEIFENEYSMHWIAAAPALIVLILSAFRLDVKLAMGASIALSIPICLFLQNITFSDLVSAALTGFHPASPEADALIGGGGIVSMLRVTGIVCISSAYSGIFEITGLLQGAKTAVKRTAAKAGPFAAVTLTSVFAAMVSCNQTLTILLTDQLCRSEYSDHQALAVDLENTAVVIAPLIPWSIAAGVPLASAGAPAGSILLAVYLYLLPLCQLIAARKRKSHDQQAE